MVWRARRDWVGYWLSLVEGRGELMAIRYGRLDAPPDDAVSGSGASEHVAWASLPHARFDGLGGLGELLAGAGASVVDGLPRARGLRPASLPRKLTAFARCLLDQSAAPAAWRAHEGTWRPVPGDPEHARPADGALAFCLLDARATAALVEGARREGITLNSLLLWALTRAVLPELVPGTGEAVWLVPVNLRGLVEQELPHANHIAFLGVPVPRGRAPREVHAALRARLDRGDPWGACLLSNLGDILGERGVRRVHAAQDPRRASAVGVFSNLGALRGTGSGRGWLFCPPVSLSQPFAAGALTWNGRLSLTIQLHPSLPRRSAEVAGIVSRWRASLAERAG